MTTAYSRQFECPNCTTGIEVKYPPPIEPSCPACGERMVSKDNAPARRSNVSCPGCGATAETYSARQCGECEGMWLAFTSETNSRQDPDSAFNTESGPPAGRPRHTAQTSWPK
jgi:transcription elongation factor Elf1